MSAVAIYDLEVPQGATWTQHLTWKSGSPATLVDLSGFSARMQARREFTSTSVAIELTTGNSRIALGGSNGTIQLSLTATDTASISSGTYVYDLELVIGATVTRLLQGNFIVTPEVTR